MSFLPVAGNRLHLLCDIWTCDHALTPQKGVKHHAPVITGQALLISFQCEICVEAPFLPSPDVRRFPIVCVVPGLPAQPGLQCPGVAVVESPFSSQSRHPGRITDKAFRAEDSPDTGGCSYLVRSDVCNILRFIDNRRQPAFLADERPEIIQGIQGTFPGIQCLNQFP